jgi:hypothetical protein
MALYQLLEEMAIKITFGLRRSFVNRLLFHSNGLLLNFNRDRDSPQLLERMQAKMNPSPFPLFYFSLTVPFFQKLG